MSDMQPIIVIRKKVHHGQHHGGAWKVAYADFVTAMMALFIVLWLLSSTSKQTQEQIAGYFNDPKGTANTKGSEGKPTPKIQGTQPADMQAVKTQLLKAIQDVNLLNQLNKQIDVTVTDEGLRVDLMENKKGTFFELGSAHPTPALQAILKVLAGQLKSLPNSISIEGHTDAEPYAAMAGYDNWELSTDRANEARREMQADGIRSGQVLEVRGFADQQLRLPERPYDPANRRVSVVVLSQKASAMPARHTDVFSTTEPVIQQTAGNTADGKLTTAAVSAVTSKATGSRSSPEKSAGGLWGRMRKLVRK